MARRDKNLVMNLVWDVAASEHATRSKLFEQSNALNVPFLKERIYGEWDRTELLQEVRHFLGLAPAPERRFAPRMEAPSISLDEEARKTLELELEATQPSDT